MSVHKIVYRIIASLAFAVSSASYAQTVIIDAYGESTTSGWPQPWASQGNMPSQLQAGLPNVKVRNLGAPSTITANMLAGITLSDMYRSGLQSCPPEVCVGRTTPFALALAASRSGIVIINRGINEVDPGRVGKNTSAELNFADQLNKAVGQARKAGKFVVLQTSNPVLNSWKANVQTNAQITRNIGGAYALPVADGNIAFNGSYNAGDLIHPSASGYQSMTNNLISTINSYDLIRTAIGKREIAKLYIGLFGRAPERDGLNYWFGVYKSGRPLKTIAQDMYNCEPSRAYYPNGMSNYDYIVAVYKNALSRPSPDAEGVAYWLGQLNGDPARGIPPKTRGEVLYDMMTVVDNYAGTHPDGLRSQRLLTYKVNVGMYYGVIAGGNSVTDSIHILTYVTDDPRSVANATSRY